MGVAEDFDGLVERGRGDPARTWWSPTSGCRPNFQNEGIEAAKLVRMRKPGNRCRHPLAVRRARSTRSRCSPTARPGYAYLLKDRVGDGDQLVRAVREVATGGSMLDPVDRARRSSRPARKEGELDEREEQLLQWIAEGRPVKAIAAASEHRRPRPTNDAIEELFLKLAKEASAGRESALRRLRLLQKAIVDREEQGETLQRLLPGGLAEKLRDGGRKIGETERMDVTVLMSDVRGYSGIAERVDPTALAGDAEHAPRPR